MGGVVVSVDIQLSVIRNAIKGEENAFETIVYTFEKKVYNIAYQMFGNEHDAYDASQEVFIKIYQKINQFKFDSAFSTWLHRISVNTCIDLYRKKKRQNKNSFSLDKEITTKESTITFELKDDNLTPEENVIQNENVKEVRMAINKLSDEHKMIIILRDINQYNYNEIAEILDVNLGTVKSRLARGRKSLKEIILKKREQNTS
jgi:RNA polymerase sigma-70 factor (ECF subfamily)